MNNLNILKEYYESINNTYHITVNRGVEIKTVDIVMLMNHIERNLEALSIQVELMKKIQEMNPKIDLNELKISELIPEGLEDRINQLRQLINQ